MVNIDGRTWTLWRGAFEWFESKQALHIAPPEKQVRQRYSGEDLHLEQVVSLDGGASRRISS